MCASSARRAARTGVAGSAALVVFLVLDAPVAAAHSVSGGTMPAPPWLLSYIGVFAVLATALAVRATKTRSSSSARAGTEAGSASGSRSPDLHLGHLAGVALFGLVLAAALVGPDSVATNIAPVTVLIIWWVGLPLVALLLGDVMRWINPFVAVVAVLERLGQRRSGDDARPSASGPSDSGADPERSAAPAWTSAVFLAAFAWYFFAYHDPGSPRALAVLMVAYALAAVAAGLRWGRAWLATGEAFGALSAAVAMVSLRGRRREAPPGVAALMVVWIGSSAFDAFGNTPFWIDILGRSQGWDRTFLNTVGLVWITTVVAGVYLIALRLADRASGASLAAPLGVALVPIGLAWFLGHDLTLLLFEGQNFIVLLSDPIGRGWDLAGTISHSIDYGIVQAAWVPWAQVAMVALGHIGAVVLAHRRALALLSPRRAMNATWGLALTSAVSIVAAALLVLG